MSIPAERSSRLIPPNPQALAAKPSHADIYRQGRRRRAARLCVWQDAAWMQKLTIDEARRIAKLIARLPGMARRCLDAEADH
jgi:hypothetical protein